LRQFCQLWGHSSGNLQRERDRNVGTISHCRPPWRYGMTAQRLVELCGRVRNYHTPPAYKLPRVDTGLRLPSISFQDSKHYSCLYDSRSRENRSALSHLTLTQSFLPTVHGMCVFLPIGKRLEQPASGLQQYLDSDFPG